MGSRLRALAVPLAGSLLFAACAAGAVSQLTALHAARASLRASGQPLYLPSAGVVRALSFGHRTTAADLLHVWSIQYFGDRVTRRERPWVAKVYDLTTDVDPRFRDAYWLGFVSVLVEAQDPAAAFALADKALREEPGFTLMAVEAALTARRMGDDARAVRYLEAASRAAADPLPLRMLLRLRTAETAQRELAEWSVLLEASDELTRSVASSHVRDLTAFIDSTRLSALLACFERDQGRPPRDLSELVHAGYLAAPATDPEGAEWVYDRRARTVRAAKPYRWVPPSRAVRGVDLSDLGRCAVQGADPGAVQGADPGGVQGADPGAPDPPADRGGAAFAGDGPR